MLIALLISAIRRLSGGGASPSPGRRLSGSPSPSPLRRLSLQQTLIDGDGSEDIFPSQSSLPMQQSNRRTSLFGSLLVCALGHQSVPCVYLHHIDDRRCLHSAAVAVVPSYNVSRAYIYYDVVHDCAVAHHCSPHRPALPAQWAVRGPRAPGYRAPE